MCGGAQTELRCGIHFDFTSEFYTVQYLGGAISENGVRGGDRFAGGEGEDCSRREKKKGFLSLSLTASGSGSTLGKPRTTVRLTNPLILLVLSFMDYGLT